VHYFLTLNFLDNSVRLISTLCHSFAWVWTSSIGHAAPSAFRNGASKEAVTGSSRKKSYALRKAGESELEHSLVTMARKSYLELLMEIIFEIVQDLRQPEGRPLEASALAINSKHALRASSSTSHICIQYSRRFFLVDDS
jgi:hypothetical protein